MQYGCAGINLITNEIVHYTEKPDTFVSTDVNAGVYLLSKEIFSDIGSIFRRKVRSSISSLSE